eukprot:gene9048-6348_t
MGAEQCRSVPSRRERSKVPGSARPPSCVGPYQFLLSIPYCEPLTCGGDDDESLSAEVESTGPCMPTGRKNEEQVFCWIFIHLLLLFYYYFFFGTRALTKETFVVYFNASLERSDTSVFMAMQPDAPTTGASNWWDALGLPAPELSATQHSSSRVVLVGYPRTGKRTLCRHLAATASAQLGGAGHDTNTAVLCDAPAASGQLFRYGDAATGAEAPEQATKTAPDAPSAVGPTGTGIAHDFVLQRTTSHRTAAGRRALEFFCCDCAGALSIALPTLESLQSSVVLLTVDTSSPNTIREQLDWCFDALERHTVRLLREYLPNEDQVRHLRLLEATHTFWTEEEHRLAQWRRLLQPDAGGNEAPGGAARTVASAAQLCVMRAIIVCTKLDLLEKLSSSCASEPHEAFGLEPAFRRSMQNVGLPLRPLVAQLVRHYALAHRCALAAISSRVVHTGAKENAATLVHPFFKGLWGYVEYLLQSYPPDGDAGAPQKVQRATGLPDAVADHCNASFFPYSLIPCGVDRPEYLNSFVAAETVTLPLPCSPQAGDAAREEQRRYMSTAFPQFQLHQDMLRAQMENAQRTQSAAEAEAGGGEEALVWDAVRVRCLFEQKEGELHLSILCHLHLTLLFSFSVWSFFRSVSVSFKTRDWLKWDFLVKLPAMAPRVSLKLTRERCAASLQKARELLDRTAEQNRIVMDTLNQQRPADDTPGRLQGYLCRILRSLSRSPVRSPAPPGEGDAPAGPEVKLPATPRKAVRFASPDKLECITPTKRERCQIICADGSWIITNLALGGGVKKSTRSEGHWIHSPPYVSYEKLLGLFMRGAQSDQLPF